MKIISFVFILLCVTLLTGCRGRGMAAEGAEERYVYDPTYAAGFAIAATEGESTVLAIKNPWQGAQNIEMRVFLSRKGEKPPKGFNGITVQVPLQRIVCMSSSYIAFTDAVGGIDAVKAVSGAKYISNPVIRERYAAGEIRDVGYDAQINYELIAAIDPDVVMIYGIAGENSALTRKLGELGINVMYIGDYVEQSPLGKAEWLVAFGEMFDRRSRAEELFRNICDDYRSTADLVSEVTGAGKPSVMLNAPYRDTWFVPGDLSYMVRLITDAGGEYACAGDDSERSRPISGEAAFVYANRSDVWLNPGQVSTMRELKSLNPRFADIPPIQNGRVFNCTKRDTPDGGSDFWESGAVRPDIVLKDLVHIIHPELLPDYETYYFKKIE